VLASFPCRLPFFSFTFSLNCASKLVYRLYFVGSLPKRVGSSLVKYNYNVKLAYMLALSMKSNVLLNKKKENIVNLIG